MAVASDVHLATQIKVKSPWGAIFEISEIRKGEKLIWVPNGTPADYLPSDCADFTQLLTGSHYYEGDEYLHDTGLWFYKDILDDSSTISKYTKYIQVSDELEHVVPWLKANVVINEDPTANDTYWLKPETALDFSEFNTPLLNGKTLDYFTDRDTDFYSSSATHITSNFTVPWQHEMRNGRYEMTLLAHYKDSLSYAFHNYGGSGGEGVLTVDDIETGSPRTESYHTSASGIIIKHTPAQEGDGTFKLPTRLLLSFNGYWKDSDNIPVIGSDGSPGGRLFEDFSNGVTTRSVATARWKCDLVPVAVNGTIIVKKYSSGLRLYAYWDGNWKDIGSCISGLGVPVDNLHTSILIRNADYQHPETLYIGAKVANNGTGFTSLSSSTRTMYKLDLSNSPGDEETPHGAQLPAYELDTSVSGFSKGDIFENNFALALCDGSTVQVPTVNANPFTTGAVIPPAGSVIKIIKSDNSSVTYTVSRYNRCALVWDLSKTGSHYFTLYKMTNGTNSNETGYAVSVEVT